MRYFRMSGSAGLVLLAAVMAGAAYGQNSHEGDLLVRPEAAFTGMVPARLWTNNTVPYVIDPDIPNPSRFLDAVAYYNSSAPVKWQPRAAEANYVHLVHSTVGNGVCMSSVGMIGGEQFLHVEDACTTATLIHEMGHAVGFLHEQSRHDRNLNVTVLYENIDKTGYSDFVQNSPPTEIDIGPYDFASHMHYGSFEFSFNTLPTLQTVPAGIPVNTYSVLAPGDLDALFRMYGQPPTSTTIVTNPPGLPLMIDGQLVTSPQVLNWAAGSAHSVGAADQSVSGIKYQFARWTDGGAASHSITADPAVTFLSVDFVQRVPVTVSAAGQGGGTVSLDVPSGDGYYASQTVLQMTATANPGYQFLRWSGGTNCPRANSANPAQIVTASAAIVCSASFTQSPVTTITTDPPKLPVTIDGVSYLQSPVNVVWTPGSSHTIATAAPASNSVSPVRYVFQGWSDGGTASHTVVASTGAATLTARYLAQYSLVLPSFDPSVATFQITPASPDGFYNAGTTVQVKAVPGAGWTFLYWTRDLLGQPNPGALVMNSQMAFGAVFSRTPPAITVVSAAYYQPGSVAPGEIVTIFGASVTAATKSVTFNGLAAPVIAASAGQISVVVPYGIAGASSAQVQVDGNAATTTTVVVDVSAPGLFTANASGLGGLAASNQDGALNTAANPATRGSVVVLYGTGAGQLTPAGVDGAIISVPLPALTQPVSVRIGGKPAQILYAGPAPGEISGVLQVNAVIPADAPTGDSVSVYLVIGLNSSPMGTTIAVR